MTLIGLAGTIIGSILLAFGYITVGGILIMVMGLVDSIDGTMARLRGMPSDFGAFVDSVTDRYSELFIYGGLLYYFTQKGDMLAVVGIYMAAGGSVVVSYIRARAASLGMDTKVGFLGRFERYLVLAPSLNSQYSHGWYVDHRRTGEYYRHPAHPGCAPPGTRAKQNPSQDLAKQIIARART